MATFEIELPDEVAEMIRAGGGGYGGSMMDALMEAMPALYAQDKTYRRTPLEPDALEAFARLFARIGRLLDAEAGHNRSFVSQEERVKRSERAKRAHATRAQRRAEGLPTDAQLEREARQARGTPAQAPNVVALFPPRPGTSTRAWPES